MSALLSHRVGQWLPHNHKVIQKWLEIKIELVDANPQPLHPVIQEFKDLIEGDPTIYMLFHQMFEQVPIKPLYNKDPTKLRPQVRDYNTMLKLFNHIITTAPSFEKSDMVGFPINAILDWPMGTEAGHTAFLNDKVNAQVRNMLNAWGTFLTSAESASVLNTTDEGWFGPTAQAEMPNFAETFICDPSQPTYGFSSWDDFFTRQFRPGVRPVDFPADDRIINNACESAPYRVASDVQARDRFWVKEQLYSLENMLGDKATAAQFAGGTIYQAFLSALSYHRWHSPVNGTVKDTVLLPGTYYSETLASGFNSPEGPDPAGPNASQAYITAVATRGLIYIEADNPTIGLMCFMAVGMAEVSTCDIQVRKGQRVHKGDELGMFHFGGSTHCLIFRPGVNVTWDLQGQEPSLDSKNLPLNSAIGVVETV